jgi:hypothetical protein
MLSIMQIDLSSIDLGRFLRNGEILLQGTAGQRSALLHTNFYSYTHPGAPFINHHWLTGVVFYAVWKLVSFEGLTIFYAVLTALAILVSYFSALRISHWTVAAPLMAIAIPNIAGRYQVRPEVFTNLGVAAVFAALLAWYHGKLSTRWLAVALPAIMALWVNLHIGFVFGYGILGMFGLKLLADRGRLRTLALVAGLCVLAGLLNPSGIWGLLLPFHVLEYDYAVSENQPLLSFWGTIQWSWRYYLFLAMVGITAAAVAGIWRRRTSTRPLPWPELLMLATVAGLSFAVMRSIPIFLLLAVPALSMVLMPLLEAPSAKAPAAWRRYAALALVVIGLGACLKLYGERSNRAGFGLRPGVNGAAEFLRTNAIEGPVWNDALMGGYLIFHRFDPETPLSGVFVDMRPEAYPSDFFSGAYVAGMTDEAVWQRLDRQYRFRALAYSLEYGAEGIEESILKRVRDPEWAPVYTDFYSLVFVRRIPEHASVIEKHLIPRDAFR